MDLPARERDDQREQGTERVIAQFPFRLGLNEGADPKELPPGTLLKAENVMMRKAGRIEKRYGTRALSRNQATGGTVTRADRIFARGDELCMVAAGRFMTWSEADETWRLVDTMPQVGVSWIDVKSDPVGTACADFVRIGDDKLFIATISGNPLADANGTLRFEVLNDRGEFLFLPPALLVESCSGVRVLHGSAFSSDDSVCIFYKTAGSVYLLRYIIAANSFDDAIEIASDAEDAVTFDACSFDGETFFVTYGSTDGNVVIKSVSAFGVTADTVQFAHASLKRTSVACDADSVTVAYASDSVFRVEYSHALVQTAGAVEVSTSSARDVYAVPGFVYYSTAIGTNDRDGVWLASRPFKLTLPNSTSGGAASFDQTFLVAADVPHALSSDFDGTNTYLLGGLNYAAKLDFLVGGLFSPGGAPQAIVDNDGQALVLTSTLLESAPDGESSWHTSLRIVLVSTDQDISRDAVDVGREKWMCTGVLLAYDGHHVFEALFARAPRIAQIITIPGEGQDDGAYVYQVGLEYRSAVGTLHRSAMSLPRLTSVGGAFHLQVWTFGTGITRRPSDSALIVYYRSTVDGSVPHRLTIEPTANYLLLDPSNAYTQLQDARPDDDIDGSGTELGSRPVVYTTGGILDDNSPPALLTAILHKSRVCGIDGGRRTIWFSKSIQDDFGVAPGFSASFRFTFDRDLVALASLDDRLVIFGRDEIWVVVGDGPAPNGQGSDLSSPQHVQSGIGCVNARSVVATHDGVLFQSRRGLEIVTRGLEVVWVGRAVEDELAAYPIIKSATLVTDVHEVRFVCANEDETGCIVLVLDLENHAWLTRKYAFPADAVPADAIIVDSCMWKGAWTFVTEGGQVYVEDVTTHLDGGSEFVTMDVQSAWISPTGKLSWQRVRRFELLGSVATDHDLEISIANDYTSEWSQVRSFDAGTLGTSIGPMQLAQIKCKLQKTQAVRFRLRDLPPSGGAPVGTGKGPIWEGFGFEIESKRGMPRAPAAEKG